MSVEGIEKLFEEVAVRRWGDLTDLRVHPRDVAEALRAGVIRRPVMRRSLGPVPGILVSAEANGSGMRDAAIAMLLTRGRGVLHGQTAGKLLRLTDSLPPETGLLVPHALSRLPRQVTFAAVRTRNERLLDDEVDEEETDLGIRVRITSPARTVADLIRSGRRDADDYRAGVKALSRYLASGGEPNDVLRIVSRLYPGCYEHASALTDSADEMRGTRPHDDHADEDGGFAP